MPPEAPQTLEAPSTPQVPLCTFDLYKNVCKEEFERLNGKLDKLDAAMRGNGKPGIVSRVEQLEGVARFSREHIAADEEAAKERLKEEAAAAKKLLDDEAAAREAAKCAARTRILGLVYQALGVGVTMGATTFFGWLLGIFRFGK